MTFQDLGLNPKLLQALQELNFNEPTPVQAQGIPLFLSGKDLVAQAQTGTGKTAAFALPILQGLSLNQHQTQALILVPTRELAIQVAEACKNLARHLTHLQVTAIYGGQDFKPQLKALKQGAQIVVGTPGRLMDHLRRGSLQINAVKTVILDEADEMLKMGFLEDVQWILEHIKTPHQTALFSATMPTSLRQIIKNHTRDAAHIRIIPDMTMTPTISQYFLQVNKDNRSDFLLKLLHCENFSAMIIFTRTKHTSSELAEMLIGLGFSAASINGDIPQRQRERVIERMKQGSLDIIVATGVAARGLDIDRIDYVINYDIPQEVESYIHRIGRTGRAGRAGKSVLFLTAKDRFILREIEETTKQPVRELQLVAPPPPSLESQQQQLLEDIKLNLRHHQLDQFRDLAKQWTQENNWDLLDVTAALIASAQNNKMKAAKKIQKTPGISEENPPKDKTKFFGSAPKSHAFPKHRRFSKPGQSGSQDMASGKRRSSRGS